MHRARVGAAVIACAVAATAVQSANAAGPILQATYNPHEKTVPVPSSFLGFSTDWPIVYEQVQGKAPGADPVFDQLSANLAAFGGGVPTLRVGGGNQDHAWWDPTAAQRPPNLGLEFNIYPYILDGLANSARATGEKLILGINMAANDPSLAADEVAAMQQTLPPGAVLAYDIGNEPDGYGQRGLYTDTSGPQPVVHTMRNPRTWGVRPYIRQFRTFANAIEKIRPRPPLAATSGYGSLISDPPVTRSLHRVLRIFTAHNYIGTACNPSGVRYPASNPHAPTIPRILNDNYEFATLGENLRALVATRPYRLPLHITEWQSYACGGKDGVTNTMAAALWALDELFVNAAIGVAGVNVHLDSYAYSPFLTYDDTTANRRAATIEALYYSMWLFAQATGHQSRLLPGIVKAKTAHGVAIRAWGARDATRTLRFVVIDKDLRRSGRVVIRVGHARGPATLIRLLAPGPSAKLGLTLGGLTFENPTYTGLPVGQPTHEVIKPQGGAYSFDVGRTTAVMLTVPKSSY